MDLKPMQIQDPTPIREEAILLLHNATQPEDAAIALMALWVIHATPAEFTEAIHQARDIEDSVGAEVTKLAEMGAFYHAGDFILD